MGHDTIDMIGEVQTPTVTTQIVWVLSTRTQTGLGGGVGRGGSWVEMTFDVKGGTDMGSGD